MHQKYLAAPVLVLLAVLRTCPALAQTNCTVSTSPVVFGNYSGFSASPTDSTGNISVRCQAIAALLVPYSISLTTGVSGTYSARTLRNGVANLNYGLHRDLTRTQVWGDGTGGSQPQPGSILLSLGSLTVVNNHTVYGRILARQNGPAGAYTDTIQVVVTY